MAKAEAQVAYLLASKQPYSGSILRINPPPSPSMCNDQKKKIENKGSKHLPLAAVAEKPQCRSNKPTFPPPFFLSLLAQLPRRFLSLAYWEGALAPWRLLNSSMVVFSDHLPLHLPFFPPILFPPSLLQDGLLILHQQIFLDGSNVQTMNEHYSHSGCYILLDRRIALMSDDRFASTNYYWLGVFCSCGDGTFVEVFGL